MKPCISECWRADMKRTLAGSKKLAILGDNVNSLHHCIGHQRGSNAAWNVLSGKTTWHDASGYQLYQTLSILKKWHLLLGESHLFHRSFFGHFILVSSWSSFVAVWFKGFDQLWNAEDCKQEDPHIPRTFTFGSHVMKPTNPEIWNHIIVIEIMQDTDTDSIHEKLGWIPNHIGSAGVLWT